MTAAVVLLLYVVVWGGLGALGPRAGRWPAVLPCMAFVLLATMYGTWAVDDAGISWSYAREWAERGVLAAYPGGPVSEGFSSPLWVMLLCLAESLGVSAQVAAKALGMILGLLTIWLSTWLLDDERASTWLAAALATSAPWTLWSVSGMETTLFGCLLVLATVLARMRQHTLAAVFAGLAAIARPEGPLLACAALAAGRAHGAVYLGPLLFSLGWGWVRWTTFGLLLPLPAYAKLSPGMAESARGLVYVANALLPSAGLGLMALVGARRQSPAGGTRLLLPVVAMMCFCIVSGGDWMRHGRFMTPVLPFLLAALVSMARVELVRLNHPWLWLAVALSPAVLESSQALTAPPLPMQIQERQGHVLRTLGRSVCGAPVPLVATPDAGGVLWGVGGVGVRDLAGLTEPHLPHQRAEVYWPEELDRAPVHALYLHGRWPQRTGLNDQVLGRVGYVPVCRRGTDATAPTLWVHRQCDLLLAPPEQAVVEQWCELGARASKAR